MVVAARAVFMIALAIVAADSWWLHIVVWGIAGVLCRGCLWLWNLLEGMERWLMVLRAVVAELF